MGKVTGFLEFEREIEQYKNVNDRVKEYKEFTIPMSKDKLKNQGARCMNCGVPFCHSGCPLGNLIPDFNDAVYEMKWEKASQILHSTNNFPEFTGRLCPAPCEEACVLGINEDPVSIENIEKNIVEEAFKNGWIKAVPPKKRTGKTVAVIGSGPAGLSIAQQLNRAGHSITIFERDKKPGGLLRYGIPDFKLEKWVIDRRIAILEEEGIIFKTNTYVGKDVSARQLKNNFDAIVLCTGAPVKKNLPIKGSNLKGVVQAMDFLTQNNKRIDGQKNLGEDMLATGKNVVVIGGGDTGSDCIGTSVRQGADSVTNFEIMNKGTTKRPSNQPWPFWPMRLRTSSSHQEGVVRNWNIATKEFLGDENGNLIGLITSEVSWVKEKGRLILQENPETQKEWKCELALLALGFSGSETTVAQQLGVVMDEKSNLKATEIDYKTNIKGVFTAGDARRGQSLIVWAISEGRQAAYEVDKYLKGNSSLPLKGQGDLPRI